MRIDPNHSLPEVQSSSVERKPVSHRVTPESTGIAGNDEDSGFAWSRIRGQLDRIGDLRFDRIAKLSQQIAAGTYNVSGEAIASAMLDELVR